MAMIRLPAAILLGLAVAAAGPAAATDLQVSPVRLALEPGQRVTGLRASNTGDRPLLIQVEVFDWSQTAGEDRLAPTREVIATPPVLEIPAGSQQVIRVGLRRGQQDTVERAYRVIVTEIPTGENPGQAAMRLALRLSLPLFVRPAAAIETGVEAMRRDEGPVLRNTGNAHLKLRAVRARAGDGAWREVPLPAVAYILPGAEFPLTLKDAVEPDQSLTLEVRTEEAGTLTAFLPAPP